MPAATKDPPAPPLPIELADPILALAMQLLVTRSVWHPTAISQPLNVVSRTHAPFATKVALMHMPHVDMNLATKLGDIGLLKLMRQWSKQPKGRPVSYSSWGVLNWALACDSVHVLEWWLDESGLCLDWFWSGLMTAFCAPEDLRWFEWWKARGYPYLEEGEDADSTFAHIAVHGSDVGRVDVLEWLLDNAGAARMASARGEYGDAVAAALCRGHAQVLQWWFVKSQTGVLLTTSWDWIAVFREAFSGHGAAWIAETFSRGHGAVLEWCQSQPLAMQEWRDNRMDWIELFSSAFDAGDVSVLEWCKNQPLVMHAWIQVCTCPSDNTRSALLSMCGKVVSHNLGLDWLHVFDLLPFAQENSNVSRKACENGQLDLVKELHSRGYLMGSRKQLVHHSLASGKLELLEWIQDTVDLSIPDRADWYVDGAFNQDPYYIASRVGNVAILDWLLANGYEFPPLCNQRSTISRAGVFGYAVKRVALLDWLFKNRFADGMKTEDWVIPLERASGDGHIDVLDSLAGHIARTCVRAAAEASPTIPIKLPVQVFFDGRVDVVEWWTHKSCLLKDLYDLSHTQSYLLACDPCHGREAESKAALKAWFDAGQPIDMAKCIHEASVHGRVDILDWLLYSAKAPEEDFVKAWTSNAFSDVFEEPSFDCSNHGQSLTWWRANLPLVAVLPVNRGPYKNPIHAHYLKHMLGNASFKLLSLYDAMDWYGGCPDLLEYVRQTGGAEELAKLEMDADWYLLQASCSGQCDVLEWFKVASGFSIECPSAIVTGHEEIARKSKAWWARSGLVDEQQLARIKVWE